MARLTNEETARRKRARVLEQLDEIAYAGAIDAMQTLADAAKGLKVDATRISAAQYLLNQVMGKPGDKEQATDETDRVAELVGRLNQARLADREAEKDADAPDA